MERSVKCPKCGEEIVNASNSTMAFEMFAKVEYFKDVVAVDCFRVIEE